MRYGAVLLLLSCALPFGATAASVPVENSKVAVLLRYDQRPSNVSTRALSAELNLVMKRAHVDVDLITATYLVSAVPRLVVFQMRGYCGMDGPISENRRAKPLGATFSSDGQLLPFAKIDCDEIRNTLASLFGRGNPQQHQILYGRAVAKVMAHELYHMLSESSEHTETGITRGSLSASDLSNPQLEFPAAATSAIEDRLGPGR